MYDGTRYFQVAVDERGKKRVGEIEKGQTHAIIAFQGGSDEI